MANENNTEQILEQQIGNMGGAAQPVDAELEDKIAKIPTEEEALDILRQREQNVEQNVQGEQNIGEDNQKNDAKQDAQQNHSMVGQKLQRFGKAGHMSQDEIDEFTEKRGLTRVGGNIFANADYREGWIDVDRKLLGDRSYFYPEDWVFRIKPATVEAIRNWSTIDENSANSIDIVFDEVLKSCLAIHTSRGPQPWNQINAWDRFFFILLIREYTFQTGEYKVSFKSDCPNCESEIEFNLNSQALMYDMPDPDVMNSYDPDNRRWIIYPQEFDIPYGDEPVVFYLPTREKDANIRNWLVDKLQQDKNAKVDRVFMKFLPWMCPKISKDVAIAKNQIRKAEIEFKSWDVDMFELMDNVLKNISVTPSTEMKAICPACGEEATAPIKFPDGVSSLFRTNSTRKKFGKK